MKEHDPELISCYVDDELQPSERERLERHFESCVDCRSTRDALRGLGSRLSAPEARRDVVGERRALARVLSRGRDSARGVTLSKPALAALAVVLLATGASIGLLRAPRPPSPLQHVDAPSRTTEDAIDISRFDGGQRLVVVVRKTDEGRTAR